MFKNYEKMFYQIKNLLLDSSNIKKLLFYNDKDALTRPEPSYEEAEKSIYIKPVIFVYDDSPEFGISSFVNIELIEAMSFDGSMKASIKISLACDRQVWELDNQRVRPLTILSEITDILDQYKFEAAGKLEFKIVKQVYYNNELIGFSALFDIDSEKGDVVNEF